MSLAPIILFVYNRPENTQRTLDALSANEEAKQSVLYIYCDGPKDGSSEADLNKIHDVRKICASEQRFKEVRLVEREKNIGLAPSIITGVTEVVNKHGDVIVLEDDILTSEYFLKFMNEALLLYKNDNKVISVGACNYFVLGEKNPSSFFIPIPDCLGWATWSDRWKLFEQDSKKLLAEITEKKLTEKFDLYGFYDFSGMLKAQAEGKISSWAIRWQAVAYLNDMITLYPNPSVTHHIESKESTHAAGLNITPPMLMKPLEIKKQPLTIRKNVYYLMVKGYYTYFDRQLILKIRKKLSFTKFWLKNKSRIISENNLV
jgi:hypothetical protein